MSDGLKEKPWLVMDAAGPSSYVGISENGHWKALYPTEGPSMENLHELVRRALREMSLSLEELEGVQYAEGPGSTLGLRLSAMFLQILLQTPRLSHWSCCSYNNLEVAAVAQMDETRAASFSLFAPWKKGHYHRARVDQLATPEIGLDTCDETALHEVDPLFVRLGLRNAAIPKGAREIAYPIERVPELLFVHRDRLHSVSSLNPYSPVPVAFARWEGKRHCGA